MKIVITGGHLTPALAFIDAFKQTQPSAEFLFIGREFVQEKEQMRAQEKEEVEKLGIPFFPIVAAKFHRANFLRNSEELMRFVPSMNQVIRILREHKPNLVVSFGGYVAFPVALAAKVLRIPVITHEQTRSAGLANQIIARIANRVAISFEESREFFPKNKVVLTGNPLRTSFSAAVKKRPEWMQSHVHKSLIYVTGGSQGSHIINKTIGECIDDLCEDHVVVHQCGKAHDSYYLVELERIRSQMNKTKQRRYIVREWISESDVAWLFQNADLVISRSGANTVLELIASKTPAIFIPLPFAHNNEQEKNAQIMESAGAAEILQQRDLNAHALIVSVARCFRKINTMKKKAQRLQKHSILDASHRLVQLCIHELRHTKKG